MCQAFDGEHAFMAGRSTRTANCPKCGAEVDDLDGFGVLEHAACGFCSHPDIFGGKCLICGEAQEDGHTHEWQQVGLPGDIDRWRCECGAKSNARPAGAQEDEGKR